MKPTVIVTKVGSVFYAGEHVKASSVVGEMGETAGVLKHLLERGDLNVVYFGQARGTMEGVTIIQPDVKDIDDMALPSEQVEVCDLAVRTLKALEPRVYIQMTGYSATMSWIDNPKGVFVQSCGVKYIAPALYAMHKLGLPPICINNDPRNYPRYQEMTLMWPTTVPAAMLSQREMDFSKVVGGKKYECREVYSGAENWAHRPSVIVPEPRSLPCTIIAHAHIKDGCKSKGRDDVWSQILAPKEDVDYLYDQGMRIYGKGWQYFTGYSYPDLTPGVVTPNRVDELLADSVCGPIVAIVDGFYTGKLRTYLQQGCAPILYGRGEPYTYDPEFKYLDADEPFRITNPGDLRKVVDHFNEDDDLRRQYVEELFLQTMPNFDMLDDCVDEVLAGKDVRSDEFFQRYGGYRAAT